jgi:hypothetical protein
VVNYLAADATGLAVTWLKYRGPGEVFFADNSAALNPTGEEVVSSAVFSQAGTYVLRAYADDGNFTSYTSPRWAAMSPTFLPVRKSFNVSHAV